MKTNSDSFLRELGREKSESYRALYQGLGWFLTVSLAFLALVGQRLAGQTFEPAPAHLWALVFAAAMTFRYFSRALLDCINMQSWALLFNAYTRVMHADEAESQRLGAGFWKIYDLYVFQWKSPIPFRKAFFDAIKIGYGYLVALEFAMLVFVIKRIGICEISADGRYWSALVVLAVVAVWEVSLLSYSRFEYAEPAEDVPSELLGRRGRGSGR